MDLAHRSKAHHAPYHARAWLVSLLAFAKLAIASAALLAVRNETHDHSQKTLRHVAEPWTPVSPHPLWGDLFLFSCFDLKKGPVLAPWTKTGA